MYALALRLTNKYEGHTRAKKREQSLFDEIEAFVWNEVENRKAGCFTAFADFLYRCVSSAPFY
jgi:hypothetical protein